MQVVQYLYQKKLAECVKYSLINKLYFVSNNMINNENKNDRNTE